MTTPKNRVAAKQTKKKKRRKRPSPGRNVLRWTEKLEGQRATEIDVENPRSFYMRLLGEES